jgi:hypothetical protein
MTKARDLSQVPNASLGFKNRLINSDMRIDQRNAGASVTVSTNGSNAYPVDRFFAQKNSSGVFTIQQSSVAPSGFTNSLVATVTTADTSMASGDFAYIGQTIEGYNFSDFSYGAAGAATFTASFWVRSNLTGTYSFAVVNSAGNRSYVANYTINTADTWEYKTVTIAGDTTGTWLKDNGAGLRVRFGLSAGSDFQQAAGSWGTVNAMTTSSNVNWLGTVGNNFYITGVQLEKGSTATSFDYRPYGTELSLCQRYFYTNPMLVGTGFNSNIARATGAHPVTMRADPTVTIANTTNFFNGSVGIFANGTVTNYSTPKYVNIDLQTTSSAGVGTCCAIVPANSGISVSAEL